MPKIKALLLLRSIEVFGDIRIYPPNAHNGIIVLKAYGFNSLQQCHAVLEMLLRVESEFKGSLFIIDANRYRKKK